MDGDEKGKLVPAPGGERILQVEKLNEGAPPDPVYLQFTEGRFAEVAKTGQTQCESPGPAKRQCRSPAQGGDK